MKQLKYIGENKPKGMILEVEEKDVDRLLGSGVWEELIIQTPILKDSRKLKEVKDGSDSLKSTKRF